MDCLKSEHLRDHLPNNYCFAVNWDDLKVAEHYMLLLTVAASLLSTSTELLL